MHTCHDMWYTGSWWLKTYRCINYNSWYMR